MNIKAQKSHLIVDPHVTRITKKDVAAFYDTYAHCYDKRFGNTRTGDNFDQRRVNEVRKALVPKKTDTLLDSGCGTGLITLPLAADVKKVIGVDISKKMLAQVRRKAHQQHITNLTLLHDDIEDLSLKNASVTKIACVGILEHTFFPLHAVGEMYRVLKKDGIVASILPNKYSPWFSLIRPLVRGYKRDMPQTQFYSPTEASRLFEAAGFHDIEVKPFGFIPPGDISDSLLPFFKTIEHVFERLFPINYGAGLLIVRARK